MRYLISLALLATAALALWLAHEDASDKLSLSPVVGSTPAGDPRENIDTSTLIAPPTEAERIVVAVVEQAGAPDIPVERRITPDQILAAFEATLAVRFAESLLDPTINAEWLPSRESLSYWVEEHRLGQIADLDPEYVCSLFDEAHEIPADEATYLIALEAHDGPLSDFVPWPGEGDIDRMWNNPKSQRLYSESLRAKHYAALANDAMWERGDVLLADFGPRTEGDLEEWAAFVYADELYTGFRRMRGSLWANEAQWQSALWRSDEATYPHWSFLMRVADRHFQ